MPILLAECLAGLEKVPTFALAIEKRCYLSTKYGKAKYFTGWPIRLSARTQDFHS